MTCAAGPVRPRSRRGACGVSSEDRAAPLSQGQVRGSTPWRRATAGRPDTTRDTSDAPSPAGRRPRPYRELLAFRLRMCIPCGMEGTPLLPCSLDELKAAHPNVTTCCVEGVHRATVHYDHGCRELADADEAGLLAKLTAALGG